MYSSETSGKKWKQINCSIRLWGKHTETADAGCAVRPSSGCVTEVLYLSYLVLIGFLLVPDRNISWEHVGVHLVVTGYSPAALFDSRDPFEFQLCVLIELPVLANSRESVNPPTNVNSPQKGTGHGHIWKAKPRLLMEMMGTKMDLEPTADQLCSEPSSVKLNKDVRDDF